MGRGPVGRAPGNEALRIRRDIDGGGGGEPAGTGASPAPPPRLGGGRRVRPEFHTHAIGGLALIVGMFWPFEGREGWCVVRAMGSGTPIRAARPGLPGRPRRAGAGRGHRIAAARGERTT